MNKNITKLLSVMLVAVMIVLMIPFATSAASDTTDSVVLSVNTLGIASQNYATGTKTIGGASFEFIQMGNYGDGLQMRDKNGNTSSIWNTTAFAKPIAKIELVYSDTKDVTHSNANAVIFTFGNEAQGATYTTKLSTTSGVKTYTITPDAETYTFFKLEHDLGFTFYWKSITIVFADGTTETTAAAPETTVAAPETTKAPEATTAPSVSPETPAADGVVLSVNTLGIASQNYATGTKTVGGTSFEFIQMGNYGNGLQMRDKNGNTSRIWNTTAFAKPIAKIELVYSDTQAVTHSNANAVIFTFGNEAQGATYTTKLSTTSGVKTYTITPDAETYTFFKLEHDLNYTFYWKSITIVFADGTTETTAAAPETTVAAPETTVAAPETTVAAPETTVAAPETTVAAPETTVAAPETTVAAPETTVAAPETTAPSNPSTGDASFVIIAMAALAGVAVAFIVSKKKVRA